MQTPRSVGVAITNRCNLHCLYCSHFTSDSDVTDELPADEWLRFFSELTHDGVMSVTLMGGEPFFRQDWREIVTGIVRNRMRFSILTNGILIDDDGAAFIAATGRCDTVQVSIDGARPSQHDPFRGRGTFVKALRGIRILQKHKVPASVRVTLHRQNVGDIRGIAELLLKEVGLPSFSTNSACYMGLCRRNRDQVQLTTEERLLAMESLLELNREYNGRLGAAAGPLAEGQRWLDMEKARLEDRPSNPMGGHLTACGSVFSKIEVRADGVMVPCIHLSHIELGRVNQDDLGEVWRTHPELQKLRLRQEIPLSRFNFCRNCDWIDYCTGGCPAMAYGLVGDIYQPSPDSCLKQFIADGGRLPVTDH